MHIKMIHDMVEKLAKCADMEIEKGIENIDAEEMSKVTDMIKDLAEAEYYSKISVAMDEAEYGEDYDYRGAYDEHERKGYRGQRRDSRGRYMSRRGYEHYMMPDMDWDDMEYQRDMDRNSHNKMYYTDGNMSGSSSSGMSSGSQGGSRGYSESRYDRARRGYEETKSMHNSGSAEDKQLTMKEAEKMINVIFDELEESLSDAPKEVKDMIKNKGMAKLQKMN